jgi:polysaccharide deacetylase family protein (PEP-CTERM system associated)
MNARPANSAPMLPDARRRCGEAAGPRFAMSVDVEDYFQVWAFSRVIDRKSWAGFPLRVEAATRSALDLFDRHGVKATFFTLGWVAERAPGLVREIAARGHEVASHGYDHAKVFDQGPEELRQDAGRAKSLLEDLTGAPVTGYRAPGFSIDERTPWAYEILAGLGYRYSSSAHPVAHDHYGDPSGPRTPFRPLAKADFTEAPVATCELFGQRMSCAGGGWFRAAPYGVSKRLIDRAAATLAGPVIFYFHPWEIDPGQPRIKSAPLKARLRHYLNLGTMEKKLERLLSEYRWDRIDAALGLAALRAAA